MSTANKNPLNSPNPLQLLPILRPTFHCSPTYSVVTWALFWNSPGISTHGVLYTDIWGFSRRTKVQSGHLRARPCWFIADFGELQHQRLFFNGHAPKRPENTVFVLKRPIFGYITLHGLVYQESFKKNYLFYATSACNKKTPLERLVMNRLDCLLIQS